MTSLCITKALFHVYIDTGFWREVLWNFLLKCDFIDLIFHGLKGCLDKEFQCVFKNIRTLRLFKSEIRLIHLTNLQQTVFSTGLKIQVNSIRQEERQLEPGRRSFYEF